LVEKKGQFADYHAISKPYLSRGSKGERGDETKKKQVREKNSENSQQVGRIFARHRKEKSQRFLAGGYAATVPNKKVRRNEKPRYGKGNLGKKDGGSIRKKGSTVNKNEGPLVGANPPETRN